MAYFVYILRTASNTLYIGQTNNLEKRLKEHRTKSSKSAKYIRYFPGFTLVYSEKYPTRKEAMQREAQVKNWTKSKKEALIDNNIKLLKRLSKRRKSKRIKGISVKKLRTVRNEKFHPGIQLADALAGLTRYHFDNPEKKDAKQWFRKLKKEKKLFAQFIFERER